MALLIIFVAIGAFALGRLSALGEEHPGLKILGGPAAAAFSLGGSDGTIPGGFVASRTGTVYYFPWCGGARSIPPEKEVWFKTEEEARAAGYTPAGNCKGLK